MASLLFSLLRVWFNAEKEEYDNGFDKAAKQLEYAFDFMESAFAGGQELGGVYYRTEYQQSCSGFSSGIFL